MSGLPSSAPLHRTISFEPFRASPLHPWVSGDCVAEVLEFPVDPVLAESGFKAEGVQENVDVFREPLN